MLHRIRRGTGRGGGDDDRTSRPEFLGAFPGERIHDLDVREQLRAGGEPFDRIMAAASQVPNEDVFRLRAIFEPVPLYGVLGDLGFRHWTERLGAEDWRIWFYRPEAVESVRPDCGAGEEGRGREEGAVETQGTPASPDPSARKSRPDAATEAAMGKHLLDVRRLEGPEKHPIIHRMFDALAPGQCLTLVNDHDPKPLYYELMAEKPDGFDADAYRSYRADDRVWVAVLPRKPA